MKFKKMWSEDAHKQLEAEVKTGWPESMVKNFQQVRVSTNGF